MSGRAGRIARAVARWGLRIVLSLLALVIVLLLVILYTRAGTRAALRGGLSIYNGLIPGSIEVDGIDGRLGVDLELAGVRLEDAAGRSLASVEQLSLTWRSWRLVALDLDLDQLAVRGARVHVGAGDWGSLAPAGPPEPEEPEPPREGLGPELPVRVRGWVQLADVALILHDRDVTTPLVSELALTLSIDAEGRSAGLRLAALSTALELPIGPVRVDALALTAEWVDPRAAVRDLSLKTSLGDLELPALTVDLEALNGAASLSLRGDRQGLAPLLGRDLPADLNLSLEASRGDDGIALDVTASAAETAGVYASARGRVEALLAGDGPLDATVELGAYVEPGALGLPLPERLSVAGTARARGPALAQTHAEVALSCVGCSTRGPASLKAAIDGDLERLTLTARAALAGMGLSLETGATLRDGVPAQADLHLAAPALALVRADLERLGVPTPPLTGALELRGSCAPASDGLACDADLDLRRFRGAGVWIASLDLEASGRRLLTRPTFDATLTARRADVRGQPIASAAVHVAGTKDEIDIDARVRGRPDERVRVATVIRPGPPLVVQLSTLEVEYRRVDAALRRPATVTVDGRKVAIDHLELGVAGGSVRAGGTLDPTSRSDLALSIDRVDLGRLAAVMPGPAIAGRLNLKAGVVGEASAPRIRADLDLAGLAVNGQALGDVALAASIERELAASLELTPPPNAGVPEIAVTVAAPLTVNLAAGAVERRPTPHRAALSVTGLDLAALAPHLPASAPKLAGRVDLTAALDGDPRAPRATLALKAVDLEAGEHVLGDIAIDAGLAGGGASLEIDVEQGYADYLRVHARAPVTLDLMRGDAGLRPGASLDASLAIEQLDLAAVNALLGRLGVDTGLRPAGRLDVYAGLRGSARAPWLWLNVGADRLALGDAELGALRLTSEYKDERARLELAMSDGPWRVIELQADAPVAVRLDGGAPRWRPARPHALTLRVDGLDLSRLPVTVEPALAGVVDVEATIAGSAVDPALTLEAAALGLERDHKRIGDARVHASWRDGQASLRALLDNGAEAKIDLEVGVPVDVDLPRGGVVWREELEHTLRLAARVDQRLLAPFVALPGGHALGLTAQVSGHGSLPDFELDGDVAALYRFAHDQRAHATLQLSARPNAQDVAIEVAVDSVGAVNVTGHAAAPVVALRRGTARADQIPVRVQLAADKLELAGVGPLLPDAITGLAGALTAKIDVDGTPAAPRARGAVTLDRGAVTVTALEQRFTDIALKLRADGRQVTLDHLKFASGGGDGALRGRVDLGATKGIEARAELTLRKLPLVRRGIPRLTVDGRVVTDVTKSGEDTRVAVVVHDAAVAVDEPTGRATKEIKRSDAVVFVDPEGVAARRRAIAAAEEAAAKPEGTLVLSLELADPIAVQGSILDMSWGGEMKVTRDARGGRAEGALASRSGWFELLENRFTLESGQVTFPEDGLDPYLDVTAIAEVDSVRVTAQVYGRASAPIIELRSEPTLDPYQIVGLLITGSAELSESDDAEIQAKAAGLLANFSSPGLRRRLRERTGIDRVGVGFGDDVTQPIVSAGKRLTRKLESEARYHHNAPPGENNVQLGFGYHFAPRWTLETFFGDAAKGGVDVFWRHSFGAPNASNARENAARQRAPGRARREKTDEDAPRRGAAATQR
ncbi:MAG: translocation/assembly module TamB domain-containing protein [Myxococcales bacterium]|nr:translocation/assembly module TamB domain-containing protein [Myxococcales bacterium]